MLQTKFEAKKKQVDQELEDYRQKYLKRAQDDVAQATEDIDSLRSLLETEKSEHDSIIKSNTQERSLLLKEVSTLENDKTVLLKHLEDIRSELLSLVEDLMSKEHRLNDTSKQTADLTSEVLSLEDDIDKKKNEITDLESSLELSQKEHIKKVSNFEEIEVALAKNISILEAKQKDLSQRVISEQQSHSIEKDNLATWKRQLDDRDRNLRIREMKVEQGEDRIVNNSNLLNL